MSVMPTIERGREGIEKPSPFQRLIPAARLASRPEAVCVEQDVPTASFSHLDGEPDDRKVNRSLLGHWRRTRTLIQLATNSSSVINPLHCQHGNDPDLENGETVEGRIADIVPAHRLRIGYDEPAGKRAEKRLPVMDVRTRRRAASSG